MTRSDRRTENGNNYNKTRLQTDLFFIALFDARITRCHKVNNTR